MSPLNGNSYPRRDLMYRVTCQSCGNTATPQKVKRDGWHPVIENGRTTAAVCNECHGGAE
ncbi:hypothetical protein [Microbacterium sp.]|uniref:hypothetical protein n=1 Tax=Microbacterium sp. TaxID=51671 RepID=UPI00391CB0DE